MSTLRQDHELDAPSPALYMARRACRLGHAERKDMVRHFQASPASQTRFIAQALTMAPCLQRRGKGRAAHIVLADPGAVPPWASYRHLLEEIADGNVAAITGIEDRELPVFIPNWTNNMPCEADSLGMIVRATAAGQALQIRYVGLRAGEQARWRQIYPVGLERMGEQWRLIATDLEHEDFALRSFVLARIVQAKPSDRARFPNGFKRVAIGDLRVTFDAIPNPELTPDQIDVLNNELRISGGRIELHHRSVFEFLRRFGAQAPSRDAVWPLLMNQAE